MENEGYEAAKRVGFHALMKWHVNRGTRPGLDPKTRGNRWEDKDLAGVAKQTSRNIQNWLKGPVGPIGSFSNLENALFGDPVKLKENDPYAEWRTDLRRAHEAMRANRNRRKKGNVTLPVETNFPPNEAFAAAEHLESERLNQVANGSLEEPPQPEPRGASQSSDLILLASDRPANPFITTLIYAAGGSILAFAIQFIAVAANHWRTGDALEGSVGLFAAYAIPALSVIIGAILGGLVSASRFQRSKKSIPLEL